MRCRRRSWRTSATTTTMRTWDEDGTEEIIALAVGSYVSGSGGSSALILKNDGTIVECLTCVNSPIVVWDEMVNGHHLLALERSGGGAETEIVALAASEDGIYANVSGDGDHHRPDHTHRHGHSLRRSGLR